MGYQLRDYIHTSTGDTTGFASGSVALVQANVDMLEDSTWDGSVGSTGYTVGDIVSGRFLRDTTDESNSYSGNAIVLIWKLEYMANGMPE